MLNILDVNANTWENDVIKYPNLSIVNFWSEFDPSSKSFDTVCSEVSKEYKGKVRFAKINVLKSTENQNIAIQNGIIVTPTLVFFNSGINKKIAIGFQKKKRLTHLIDDIIKYN